MDPVSSFSLPPVHRTWRAVFCAALFTLGCLPSSPAQSERSPVREHFDLKLNLDTLLSSPTLWETSADQLDSLFTKDKFKSNPYFKWLSESRESARFSKQPYNNVSVDITLFNGEVHADEVVVGFKQGRLDSVNVSLYNRGDSGSISKDDFNERYRAAGAHIGQWLGVHPVERAPSTDTALKLGGWLWSSPTTLALLEYNATALVKPSSAEFLRLKLGPPSERDALLHIAAIGRDTNTLKRSELPQFVKKESNGDVYVGSVPMVDQGAKGYCVCASCQRIFEYFHIPCDEHELAALAGSSAERGTNSREMEMTLKKMEPKFKVHFKPLIEKYPGRRSGANRLERPDHFLKMIQDYVDKGVPLLWGLEVGLVPEEPALSVQTRGGHMRLIIGYNTTKDQILFTDSWGQGHELKRMKLEDAINATGAIYDLEPRDFY